MTALRPLAVGLTPLETRRDVVLQVAARAEELGYSALFVAEGWGHDVSVLLAEIAMRTSRIRIGTGVLNVWGRSAASIAMLATSLAELSGGRFVLGLGAGSPQLAEGLHDVAFRHRSSGSGPSPGRCAGCWTASAWCRPSRVGAGRCGSACVRPREISIVLAALGPQAVRLCGEVGDGWYPFLLPLSGLQDGVRLLDEGAARGRPGGSGRPRPQICPGVPTAVSPDPVQARAVASWWVAFYLTSMGPLYAPHPAEPGLRGRCRRRARGESLPRHDRGARHRPSPDRRADRLRGCGRRASRPGPLVRRRGRDARDCAAAEPEPRRVGTHPRRAAPNPARTPRSG